MADAPTLADLLRSGQLAQPAIEETVYGPFGEKYDVEPAKVGDPLAAILGLRSGFRGMPQARFPGPWSVPERPAAAPARQWKQPGDDSAGQHIYEALLGRTRAPGEAVASKDSAFAGGKWYLPKNPIPWIGVGGIGYAGYKGEQKLADDWADLQRRENGALFPPLRWLNQSIGNKPFTPEELAQYEAAAHEASAGPRANLDAAANERKEAVRVGATQPHWLKDFLGFGLNHEEEAATAQRRLPGGIGNVPY